MAKPYIQANSAGFFIAAHLSDATTWNTDKAMIKTLICNTASTNWDLYILQNDNGIGADDANVKAVQVMSGGNLAEIIQLDHPYEDEDGTKEFHVFYAVISGVNASMTLTVIGVKLA